MLRFLLLTLTVFIFSSFYSFGQQISDVRIDEKFDSELLTDVLSQIEANSSVKFFYDPAWLENVRVSGEYSGASLRSALEDWTANTRLNYHFYDAYNVVLYLRSDLLSTL
ncbi:MAG: hypothetical protein RIB86_16585, partial [Imperialibacter sp.]